MSKAKFSEQAEKLKSLVGSARLQTSSQTAVTNDPAVVSDEKDVGMERPEAPKTRAKNLKAIPLSYFAAHAELRSMSKTSLDFSSYIMEALREKLERDGVIGK